MNLDTINGFFNALTNRELWARIGIGFVGANLIVFGVVLIVLGDKALTDVVSGAAKAGALKTPQGAALAAVTGE